MQIQILIPPLPHCFIAPYEQPGERLKEKLGMDQVIVVCTSKVVQTTKQWYEPWSVVSKPLWAGSNHFSWFKPRRNLVQDS